MRYLLYLGVLGIFILGLILSWVALTHVSSSLYPTQPVIRVTSADSNRSIRLKYEQSLTIDLGPGWGQVSSDSNAVTPWLGQWRANSEGIAHLSSQKKNVCLRPSPGDLSACPLIIQEFSLTVVVAYGQGATGLVQQWDETQNGKLIRIKVGDMIDLSLAYARKLPIAGDPSILYAIPNSRLVGMGAGDGPNLFRALTVGFTELRADPDLSCGVACPNASHSPFMLFVSVN